MSFPLPGANWTYIHSPRLVATTGVTGYTLVNATKTILSWTAPNDGNLHRVTLFATKSVTSGETGGAVTFGSLSGAGNGHLTPDGDFGWATVYTGGNSTACYPLATPPELIVGPGNTIFLYQESALSAGASVLYAEIWAL
jgi:hypothetical protein